MGSKKTDVEILLRDHKNNASALSASSEKVRTGNISLPAKNVSENTNRQRNETDMIDHGSKINSKNVGAGVEQSSTGSTEDLRKNHISDAQTTPEIRTNISEKQNSSSISTTARSGTRQNMRHLQQDSKGSIDEEDEGVGEGHGAESDIGETT